MQDADTDTTNGDILKHKSTKKRKGKDVDDTVEVDEEVKVNVDAENTKPIVESASKKKTKKQKRSDESSDSLVSGFPDPSEDSSLTEKAQNGAEFVTFIPAKFTFVTAPFRSALSNALLRIAYPELWKFNKASQIWLVKNFWVPEAVRNLLNRFITF